MESPASFWTDKKHVEFLNSIEASFVTAMLENSCSSIRRPLIEASESESTSDLNLHRTVAVKNRVSGRCRIMKGRRSMRRRSYQACNFNSLQDQVVPQIENRQHDITDDSEQASTVE